MAPQPLVFCTFCGRTGHAVTRWRGSKYVARLLWTTLLLPGPLYNYWQWRGRKQVCSHCGSEYIEPTELHRSAALSYDEMAHMAAEAPFLAAPEKLTEEKPKTEKPKEEPPKEKKPRPPSAHSDPNQF